jgi:hypothetical protein
MKWDANWVNLKIIFATCLVGFVAAGCKGLVVAGEPFGKDKVATAAPGLLPEPEEEQAAAAPAAAAPADLVLSDSEPRASGIGEAFDGLWAPFKAECEILPTEQVEKYGLASYRVGFLVKGGGFVRRIHYFRDEGCQELFVGELPEGMKQYAEDAREILEVVTLEKSELGPLSAIFVVAEAESKVEIASERIDLKGGVLGSSG